jgi:hypothetical protein
MQGIFNASLLLLHVGFGFGTDADHSYATGQLCQTLLELFLVVFAVGLLDLSSDLSDASRSTPLRSPPPSTMVVLFLSTTTFFARPRCSSETFSNWRPRSSLIKVPPVNVAISPSIALRRSPKPGALTAQTFKRATQLVHNQKRQRFCIDIFANDQQGLTGCADLFKNGTRSRMLLIFFS